VLLADSPTGRISTTYNQRMQLPIGTLYYGNLTQYLYGFVVYKVMHVSMRISVYFRQKAATGLFEQFINDGNGFIGLIFPYQILPGHGI
jgi:hypothetical protein